MNHRSAKLPEFTVNDNSQNTDAQEQAANLATDAEDIGPAWEEIEPGRYMPRRVRGSFRGRALG